MYLWHRLKTESLPILIYGMGNGAEKILSIAEEYDIPISGIFASNDHARNNIFRGYTVMSYDEAMARYENAVILTAFGVYQEDVIRRVLSLAETYTVFAPDVPLMGGDILDETYLSRNKETIETVRKLFSDEKSRLVFDAMLDTKLTGELTPLFSQDTSRWDDLSLLQLGHKEDYLDLGAYNGDTIDEFLAVTDGNYASITAFEPDAHNLRKLRDHTAALQHITLYPYASWGENSVLTFTGKGGRNCAMKPELPGQYKYLHQVEAVTVDSLNRDFSYVKMDVEGAEAETLSGMKQLLNRCHPKLLISCYHKPDDFITLPLLLNEICPGYRMYLRRNRCLPAWEIQLYCVYPQNN